MNLQYIAEVGLFRFIARSLVRQFFKRVLRRGIVYRLPTGCRIYLPPENGGASEVYVTGASVDHGSEKIFLKYLDSDKDVIDVGANIGYYACLVSPCVRHVWAFEPDTRLETGGRFAALIGWDGARFKDHEKAKKKAV